MRKEAILPFERNEILSINVDSAVQARLLVVIESLIQNESLRLSLVDDYTVRRNDEAIFSLYGLVEFKEEIRSKEFYSSNDDFAKMFFVSLYHGSFWEFEITPEAFISVERYNMQEED